MGEVEYFPEEVSRFYLVRNSHQVLKTVPGQRFPGSCGSFIPLSPAAEEQKVKLCGQLRCGELMRFPKTDPLVWGWFPKEAAGRIC